MPGPRTVGRPPRFIPENRSPVDRTDETHDRPSSGHSIVFIYSIFNRRIWLKLAKSTTHDRARKEEIEPRGDRDLGTVTLEETDITVREEPFLLTPSKRSISTKYAVSSPNPPEITMVQGCSRERSARNTRVAMPGIHRRRNALITGKIVLMGRAFPTRNVGEMVLPKSIE